MKPLTLKEISNAVGGTLYSDNPEAVVTGVSIDSRTVKPGDLFIPIIGEIQDGHEFIPQAIAMECGCFLTGQTLDKWTIEERATLNSEGTSYIEVKDTTKALQELARYYLSAFRMKKIGITGSTGKTSTKDMVYSICSEKYKTARNIDNFNNHIGLPLTILSFEEGTEVGVLEMGMSEKGEIDLLAELVRPDVGVITNIGTAHIENLGTREAILEAKMEIVRYFTKDNVLIVNRDSELLNSNIDGGDYKTVTVGENGKSDRVISNIVDNGERGISFTLEQRRGNEYTSQEFKLPVPGRHNAYNAALAVSVGLELGISLEECARGLEKMVLTDKRLSIKGKNGIKIIDDTYNASVDSMKSGLDVLETIVGMRKIAILGDMLEMGLNSDAYHMEIGEYLSEKNFDLLISVGTASKNIAKGASKTMRPEQMIHFDDKDLLIKKIKDIIQPGDAVLLKGSRGMKLDKVVEYLMED